MTSSNIDATSEDGITLLNSSPVVDVKVKIGDKFYSIGSGGTGGSSSVVTMNDVFLITEFDYSFSATAPVTIAAGGSIEYTLNIPCYNTFTYSPYYEDDGSWFVPVLCFPKNNHGGYIYDSSNWNLMYDTNMTLINPSYYMESLWYYWDESSTAEDSYTYSLFYVNQNDYSIKIYPSVSGMLIFIKNTKFYMLNGMPNGDVPSAEYMKTITGEFYAYNY